jgi:hypothetical protein
MSNKKQSRSTSGGVAALVVAVVSVLLALALLFNRQYIVDQFVVWQYQPSPAIAALAERSGMDDDGTFYFYASQPALEDAQVFNERCAREEEGTAILGCYTGQRIYIYNVTDQQLDGIREVTAAHEMLHAVYSRLSDSERSRVDALIEAEYAKIKNDSQIAERLAFYDRTEPGERDNELHSIIGTEIAQVSSELESYYSKYFKDRNKVVVLYAGYVSVFNALQARADSLSVQLTALGNAIEQNTELYSRDVRELNSDIQAFNHRAGSGGFETENEFQTEKSALLVRSQQLDVTRAAINADVAQYEQLRAELESVAGQSNALNRSIDSTLAPTPSV